jgi:aldehyde dehydrogenase (NAD+)
MPEMNSMLRSQLLIGPEWVAEGSSGTFQHINPATGRVQQVIPMAGPAEVNAAVAAAREALPAWRRWAPAERAAALHRLADRLRSGPEETSTILTLENGTPASMTLYMGASAAIWFDYYAGWIDKLVGDVYSIPGMLDYTMLEPFGVVAIIPTWNGPLAQIGFKVAPALAAGCTVILKSPEVAPFSGTIFGEACLDAGIPPGVINVITGGPEAGDVLVRHPDVDKVSFTGGPETARLIQAACAESLTPLVLELGGKSANIVFEDANIGRTVGAVTAGITTLSGQICVAPTRLLVQDSIYEEVKSQLAGAFNQVRLGNPFDPATTMGPVISGRACDRILEAIEEAGQSSKLLVGGNRLTGELADGYFINPTVFVDVDPQSPLAQNEVFGPVLAVSRFSDEADAVHIANDSPYGLAAYVQTTDLSRAHRMASELDAGNISVNDGQSVAGPVAPFGGFKDSGYGKEGGLEGIMEYLRVKNISIGLS